MTRRTRVQAEAPGQDSFLDVICNLVGIFIVLVMVVGAQAKRAMVAREAAKLAPAAIAGPPKYDVESAAGAARAVASSINELQRRIAQQSQEAALREAERNRLQVLVTVAEQRLAEHRDGLSTADRERYDLQQKLRASQQELATLEQSRTAISNAPPEVIPHLPTPMAKTVFGKEVHFRLLHNELAYVPWEQMLDRMKADAPNHVAKLRDSPRVELSLPVIEGFGARYILRRAEVEMQTRVGTATQSRIELERLYFVQAEPQLGETLERALQPNSQLRSRLAAYDPQRTTVTVWVYPDSFESFRQLKHELFKLGFLTAGRPLPENFPIGGSPDGSRSTAE
jgi:hypothetical protein